MRLIAYSFAAAVVLLACSSCSKMPKDWPLATFKPPKGSTIMAIPRKINNVRERLNMLPDIGPGVATHPDWQVAFDFPAGWDPLVADADTRLKALGYTEWQPQRRQDDDAQIASLVGILTLKDAIRIYIAPDKSYTVVVLNAQTTASEENAIEHEGGFVYQISKGVADKPS